MSKSRQGSVNRRGFLKGAAAGAAAIVGKVEVSEKLKSPKRSAGRGPALQPAEPQPPPRAALLLRHSNNWFAKRAIFNLPQLRAARSRVRVRI
jgi:hypothetical protein